MVADEVEHNDPVGRMKTLDLGSLESFKVDLDIAHSLFLTVRSRSAPQS
jgi:hypothetical protein